MMPKHAYAYVVTQIVFSKDAWKIRQARNLSTESSQGVGDGAHSVVGASAVRVNVQTVGNDLRKEYTALGDFVNLAARLMAKAGPREIYVDA